MLASHTSFVASAVATVLLLGPSLVGALKNNDQMNANIDYGTFQNPSMNVRPRFRYWVPDASVNATVLANDIEDVVDRGAGGVEVLGYYLYGARSALPLAESDWATYGWGTNPWNNLQDTALQVTKDTGAIVDLALGPNQGSGVPVNVSATDGLQVDIRPFTVNVTIGGTYNGLLPGWGYGELVAATTGLVSSWYFPPTYPPPSVGTLVTSSLQDVTSQVSANGTINITFPSNATGLNYVLFAFYLFKTNYVEQTSPINVATGVPQSKPTSFRQNGSFVWDHFSAEGAEVAINYWNEYELTTSTSKTLKQVGEYVWEDSQEFRPTYAWWTPALPSMFATNRGYDMKKYMPAIVVGYGGHNPPQIYKTDEADTGLSHLEDYRETLTEANAIYLKTMTAWAQSRGVQYSAQVAYNLPLDMPALVPYVNGPECESLNFAHNIDGYRQFTGAADLAGKRVVSSELGAVPNFAYQQTIPYLLWDVKRSFAGGVRAYVFHGYPYSGSYPNTTWPGFTTFDYGYSEMHGSRQPAWDYYQGAFVDYTARNMWIQQSGFAKLDLAFYIKNRVVTGTNGLYYTGPSYMPNDLNEAGYTYEYLSPDNFNLPAAHVSNKILAPSRQSFQALVVRANDSMTVEGVRRIAQFAHNGLPIIFNGGIPGSVFWGYNATGAAYVNSTLAEIAKLKNVYTVPYDNLATSIASIGIVPRTQVNTNGTWYMRWVESTKASTTYVYIYNDATFAASTAAGYTTGTITFATTGAPMLYDAWTGAVTPITVFTETESSITIPFTIAGNQTIIVGFLHGQRSTATVASTTVDTLSVSPIQKTSNGASSYTVKSKAGLAPFTLGPWNLTIESWAPPANLFSGSTAITNLSTITLATLTPWQSISSSSSSSQNLTTISGRGFYSTTFTWPPTGRGGHAATGAIIDLGALIHTATLSINGAVLPPLDPTWARADIGGHLKKGENTVEVVVTTTLGNALLPIWKSLRTSGQNATSGAPGAPADYGLVGSVVVMPYRVDEYTV